MSRNDILHVSHCVADVLKGIFGAEHDTKYASEEESGDPQHPDGMVGSLDNAAIHDDDLKL